MADTQALAVLLARVESGTGEDRELDASSWMELCPDDMRARGFWDWRARQPKSLTDRSELELQRSYARSGRAPKLTSSLDSVRAMVPLNENVIGYTLTVRDGSCDAHVWAPEGYGPDIIVERDDEDIARALLAALIKAKMEEIAQ